MSVPAGLMQALQQGGAGGPGPGAGSGPSDMPPSITIGGPDGGDASKGDGDWETDLQAALDALRELAADAHDHVETNVVDTCIKALSGLLAGRQKGHESALGVTPAHKAMSRAY